MLSVDSAKRPPDYALCKTCTESLLYDYSRSQSLRKHQFNRISDCGTPANHFLPYRNLQNMLINIFKTS